MALNEEKITNYDIILLYWRKTMSKDYDERGLLRPEATMTESERRKLYIDNTPEKNRKKISISTSRRSKTTYGYTAKYSNKVI